MGLCGSSQSTTGDAGTGPLQAYDADALRSPRHGAAGMRRAFGRWYVAKDGVETFEVVEPGAAAGKKR